MNLRFFVDAKALAAEFGERKEQVEEAITQGVKQVASMTFAKTQELAASKLHSRRKTYLDNLKFEEAAPSIWVVSLDEPALWIEEGRKAGDMTADLLKRNYKVAKDGSKYRAIPFDQAKPPSQTPQSVQMFVNQVKAELKARKIPYKKLEYTKEGSPRLGKLHVINDIISPKPSARASHGVLSGLTIYQTQTAKGSVRRDILTFRTVSSKHRGSKWIHPGLEAEKLMDQALEWASNTFDKEILPSILESFDK